MNNGKKAEQLFKEGYNCAQAVLAAFCEELDMDMETALKISSSFGGGMGRLREVCGAVSGMFMVAGLKKGYNSPTDDLAKKEHYALIQEMAKAFSKENGSIVCRELLDLTKSENFSPDPTKRNDDFYKKRPCSELVKQAAEIAQSLVFEK